ncbi:MAG TPA: prolipoprotein diacylglyceryl transferase [Firmicutes bacterium]|jgi:phosphatidylglycerol---prolipoprotein diacylglyceryl transferase|nr:prolipoprotein diacylglyceryl transferase [Bacillota bacterium]
MRPVLFSIFGWPIHSYGLMLAIAFVVAIFGVGRAAKKQDIKFEIIVDFATWVLIGAVVGARLAYVITEYRYFIQVPWWEVLKVNSGGLAFHGGLLGGFLAGYIFIRHKRIFPWKLADIVTPYIALGYSIVRIGCFLNGCCYGKVTTVPWALRCAANDISLRHPTQLYSMLGSLILFVILWRLRNHKRFAGFLFLLYIGLYSIMRFIVEIFRESPMVFPWLSLAQLVCIILGIVAFGLIGIFTWHYRDAKLASKNSQVS